MQEELYGEAYFSYGENTITQCSNYGNIYAMDYAGGISGYSYAGSQMNNTVSYCINFGIISANQADGIANRAGYVAGTKLIENIDNSVEN